MIDLIEKINRLKKERNACILAHNYQMPEIYDIADYSGDSLGLSIQASKTNADVIVFCGVYFMAETAKILSPQKTVLIPDKEAGCPLADMINVDNLGKLKEKHPAAKVLCYVNTPADVKAEADYCCTSSNAIDIVKGPLRHAEDIIFVPDKYLAHYVSTQVGRSFITWNGYCPTHVKILPEYIDERKKEHPEAVVMVHPECNPETIKIADQVLSTGGMCNFAKSSSQKSFIVGTENGLLERLRRENPGKRFYPATDMAICPNMKRITLEKILWSLERMQYQIYLPERIISRAGKSIRRMIDCKERSLLAGQTNRI